MGNLFRIVLILLLSLKCSYSQNIENLDKKFGIKHLVLGTQYANEAKNLKFKEKKSTNSLIYEYDRNILNEVFGYKTGLVLLGYFKNSLYDISIYFEKVGIDDEKIILEKLNALFGTGAFFNEPDKFATWAYAWETNKTYLGFQKLKDGTVSIYITSKKLNEEVKLDEF